MNTRFAALMLAAAGTASFLAGCIHHEETVYRDVSRTSVSFESDKAARVFYEALNEGSTNKDRTESKTQIHLPLVFDNQRRVVSGPNAAFNRGVEICDSNRDGRITEQEARIFAETR